MSYSINNIRKLLDARLTSVSQTPQHEAENTKIKPGIDPWCRSTVIPAKSTLATVGAGASMLVKGIYQVDLMYPAAYGTDSVSAVADAVVAAFFPGSDPITDESQVVNVSAVSQLAGYVNKNLEYVVPIQIDWFTFVTNS